MKNIEPSGIKKIEDEKGNVKVRFIRPVLRLCSEEVKKQCMMKVDGYAGMKHNPLLLSMVAQNPDNFYRPGETYSIPLEQAQRFVAQGIPIRHIDNSKAKNVNEVVTKTDVSDPRLKDKYPVAEFASEKLQKKHKKEDVKGKPVKELKEPKLNLSDMLK